MFNKTFVFVVSVLLFGFLNSKAQNCNLSIKGFVFDEATQQPLPFVNVFVQETYQGAITDTKGNFILDSLCPGAFHLQFSHIGCESIKLHFNFIKDTIIKIGLSHTSTSLGMVLIEKDKNSFNNQPNLSVNRNKIEKNPNKNISNLLENESGVHLIKNGNGISKPVVHGLYGNRLSIFNNGVLQSGQQWGNDHSPEIDPFAADKITVLKGANALEFGGGNLGSAILIEPKRILKEPHLHGQVSYVYETNGKGHNLNARLEKYASLFAWRINGTLKKYGDQSSSNYYLNNTGIEEANLSIQIEKTWKKRLFLDFYASTFNTRLGVLRGSHIGNLTNLEAALKREIPFYTEENFSNRIEAPRQDVSHHLAKIKSKYFFSENQFVEILVATQINNRKEFDVRRGNRDKVPALSLLQYTFNSEIKYNHDLKKDWSLKIGNQNIFTDNTNDPKTGILPLIPDYESFKTGFFSTLAKRKEKSNLNFGLRYDFEHQKVWTISSDLPRRIIRYKNQFHNLTGLFSFQHEISKTQNLSFNSGFAMRNPAINELYSRGLHQGVSGIEEGKIDLRIEKAIKNTLEYKWFPNTNFSLNALVYHQYFKDYIFLNPQNEFRLTIRGAFPVFKYEQTNAQIYGMDFSAQFSIKQSFLGIVKYSYLRGQDLKNEIPLVFMPPNSFFGSLTYQVQKGFKFAKNFRMEKLEIELNNRFVMKQNNLLIDQDFAQPPDAYNLLGLNISSNLNFKNNKIRFFINSSNLLNTSYRDYLNRQRYFADDLGRSITFGFNVKF